jgi:hypothetical protein
MRCRICDEDTRNKPDWTGHTYCDLCKEDVSDIVFDWMAGLDEDDFNYGYGEKGVEWRRRPDYVKMRGSERLERARQRARLKVKRKSNITLIDTSEVED